MKRKYEIALGENPWGKKIYVRSTLATACDGHNNGENPASPLMSIQQAVKLADPYDTIIVGEDHVEVIVGEWKIDKCLDIVCRGRGKHRPLFSFVGDSALITITAEWLSIVYGRCALDDKTFTDRVKVEADACFTDLGEFIAAPPAPESEPGAEVEHGEPTG